MADKRKYVAQRQTDGSVQSNMNVKLSAPTMTAQQMTQGSGPKISGTVIESSPVGSNLGKPWVGTKVEPPKNDGSNGAFAKISTPTPLNNKTSNTPANNISPGSVAGTGGLKPITTPSTPTNAQSGAQGSTFGTGGNTPTIGGTNPSLPGLNAKTSTMTPASPGEEYVYGLDELDETQRMVYDSLSPLEKKTFNAIAKNDYAAKADYLEKQNKKMQSMQKQEDMRIKSQALSDEGNAAQSKMNLQKARETIGAMKQRIAYLGTRGQPGVSQAGIDNVNNEIIRAEGILDKMYQADSRMNEGSQIKNNYDAENFSRQFQEIVDDLNEKVGKEFQAAYNTYTKAVLDGKFDTEEDVEKFREQLYASVDQAITGFSDTNLKQLQFLVERGDKLAEDISKRQEAEAKTKAEQEKAKYTLNKDMSLALGYYVNGLGDPVLDAQGQIIVTPPDIIGTPSIDEESGYMTWLENVDGVITPRSKQVMPGRPGDMTENIYVDDGFGGSKQITVYKGTTTPVIGSSGTSTIASNSTSNNQQQLSNLGIQTDQAGNMTGESVNSIANACINLRAQAGKQNPENMQCGALNNYYIQALTGKRGGMGNDYASKQNVISELGKTNEPVVGGLFLFKGPYVNGHTGIVTGINSDGSINVLEANATGTPNGPGEPPEPGRYYDLKGFEFSQAPGTTSNQKGTTDLMSIYQVLTESGQSDTIAKKNAASLAKSGKTLEQIKQEYPNQADSEDIKNIKDGVVKLKTKFDESNNRLSALNSVLNKENVTGKDIEIALKSFVSAIDNTAAMAGEVEQARNAGVSQIQQWEDFLAKKKDGKVSEKTRKDIINTINSFHTGIKDAYDSYVDTQQQLLNQNYGEFQANKLNVYKRPDQKKVESSTQFKEGGIYTKDGLRYKFVGGKWYKQP